MSGTVDSIRAVAMPQLETLASDLADTFLDGFKDHLAEADAAARGRVQDILKEGANFKLKAMTAEDQLMAREYAEAVETTVRRVKTILLAERLVAEESAAALIAAGFSKALSVLGDVAVGIIKTVASGLVSGAIAGLTGGEGGGSFDPSDIFPFA